MGTATTLLSVDEYLRTVYEPDCDFVDGELEDRNVGEKSHSKVQKKLLLYLEQRHETWNIFVIQELRVQVSATRFRIPDVSVVFGPEPEEEILTTPPFICIEIVSPEDRMSRMERKIEDYFKFGVRYVWVLDPIAKRAWVHTPGLAREAKDELRTENPEITVPLNEVFS